ncbi:uncharacterized protein LOC131168516 [Malania oleifera]|uniref:uncharacterized protein LOC131168516 n=1 Tax=Malania oleifera TaxID=397392 RepID=UPI0025AE2561|nr:uncharacterized protein LOC131168516 [Malania oleifera]
MFGATAMKNALKSIANPFVIRAVSSQNRRIGAVAAAGRRELDGPSSSSADGGPGVRKEEENGDANIYVKAPGLNVQRKTTSSVTLPTSAATGSIAGKRFYEQVSTREAEDGNGWSVMLDYRTLRTPSKRPLKLPTLALAEAIAAEWEYQQTDGIRPFTMPLMKLACTALERVPLTRPKIIENLMRKFHQDLVFYRAPGDNDLTSGVRERQEEKIDPLLDWVESNFGVKPAVYSSFFGGKQEDSLMNAIESLLKNTNDSELAAIDAIAAAARSLVIAVGIFRGKLQIEEAIELIRLEEDLQVEKWGLVEGGHDVDIADLKVQISSAAVFLGLSRKL